MQLLQLPFTAQGALALLALLAVSFTGNVVSGQNCQVRPRHEFRDLSPANWQSVVAGLRSMQRSGEYDRLVRLHVNNQETVHSGPNFLPWHRYYILRVERSMQQEDASIMLPYWNWAYDSQAPEESPLFTDAYLGGNGRGQGRCVQDGQFSDWRPANPEPHCLTRDWDLGDRISSLYGVEVINRIVAGSMVYETFRTGLESAPHGAVHNNIGSDFSTMVSPNDPIFWLHHAFVDKIWADWQRRHPELANTYGGTNQDGSPARLTDPLITSEYTVADVMDTRALCYEYAELQNTSGPASPPPPGNVDGPANGSGGNGGRRPGGAQGGRRDRRRQRGRNGRRNRLVRRAEKAYGGGGDSAVEPFDASVNDFTGGFSMIPTKASYHADVPCDDDDNDNDNNVDNEVGYGDSVVEEPHVTTVPYAKAPGPRRVSPADRSDLLAIRTPRPLPATWIRMQGMDVTAFRQEEGLLSRVCAEINSLQGYASPAALLNRRDVLQKLVSRGRGLFYAIADGRNMTLTGYTDVDAVSQTVSIPVPQSPEGQNTWQSVEQVIGKIVYPEVAAVLPPLPDDKKDCDDY